MASEGGGAGQLLNVDPQLRPSPQHHAWLFASQHFVFAAQFVVEQADIFDKIILFEFVFVETLLLSKKIFFSKAKRIQLICVVYFGFFGQRIFSS